MYVVFSQNIGTPLLFSIDTEGYPLENSEVGPLQRSQTTLGTLGIAHKAWQKHLGTSFLIASEFF